jgi:hypothetical protein
MNEKNPYSYNIVDHLLQFNFSKVFFEIISNHLIFLLSFIHFSFIFLRLLLKFMDFLLLVKYYQLEEKE